MNDRRRVRHSRVQDSTGREIRNRGMRLKKALAVPVRWFRSFVSAETPIYAYEPTHEVVNDYADFSGLSIDEIARCINVNTELNQQNWEAIRGSGSWQGAASRFYELSPTYVFDLLWLNCSKDVILEKLDRFNSTILRLIRDHPGKDFLEFGGGLGVFCEIVSAWGKRVTYLDIPGHVLDFARWRFRKYRLPVEVILSSPTELRLDSAYDIIFTDAVFEHLIHPHEVLGELLGHIKVGGVLILLIDLGGEDERPMHRPIDVVSLHRQIREAGLLNAFGENTFASAWIKP